LKQPGNYRGITVTSILGKVLEKVLQKRIESQINDNQNREQRGFTKGSSSNNASILVIEAINGAKETKAELFMATLDCEKAFDVVNHDVLFSKLYTADITGDTWLLLHSLYDQAAYPDQTQ
jgi:hypothetical protein